MKPRRVVIQAEVETDIQIKYIQKWLRLLVRGAALKLMETPKVNVIRRPKA